MAGLPDELKAKLSEGSALTPEEVKQVSEYTVFIQAEAKKAFEARDAAKKEALVFEEAEKKRKDDELLAQNKHAELLKQRETELAAERESAKQFKQKAELYDATDKTLRDGAMAKITDEKMKAIAAELSTPRLLEFVGTIQSPVPGGPKGAPIDTKKDVYEPLKGESAYAYADRIGNLRGKTG